MRDDVYSFRDILLYVARHKVNNSEDLSGSVVAQQSKGREQGQGQF